MKTSIFSLVLIPLLILIFCDGSNAWRRRRRRRCPYRDCSVSKWSNWKSCSVPCGNNGVQTRTRKKTVNEQCGGRCSHAMSEVRACNLDVCKGRGKPRSGACLCFAGYKGTCCEIATCHYNKCVPSKWSHWTEVYPTQYGICKTEERSRSYHLIIQTIDQDKCGDPGSQTCPIPEKQTREKDTFCEPLTPPLHGITVSSECTSTKQRCGNICTLKCDEENGYKKKGKGIKTCLMDGTWDGEEFLCEDVQAPDVTCPDNVTVTSQNDINIHVALLPPVSSDNSGKTPIITTSVGGFVGSFDVADEPYMITYTATDSANNKNNCSFTVTVKLTTDIHSSKALIKLTKGSREFITGSFRRRNYEDNHSKTKLMGTDKPKCLDKDSQCSLWEEQGWCERSPGLMQSKCCKSCSEPCKDTDENCQDWKVDGFCDRNNPNFGYAKQHCRKTCDAC